MARRAQPEALIQRTVLEHVRLRRSPGWLIWATPNGARRSPRLGAELKRQGLAPGVGDLSLVSGPAGKYHELELKTAAALGIRKGRLSPAQRARALEVQSVGGIYAVAHGIDEALATLASWGAIR